MGNFTHQLRRHSLELYINVTGQRLTRMYVNFHWLQFDCQHLIVRSWLLRHSIARNVAQTEHKPFKLKFPIMRGSIFDYLKTFWWIWLHYRDKCDTFSSKCKYRIKGVRNASELNRQFTWKVEAFFISLHKICLSKYNL